MTKARRASGQRASAAVHIDEIARTLSEVSWKDRLGHLKSVLKELDASNADHAALPQGEVVPALDRLYALLAVARTPAKLAEKALLVISLLRTVAPSAAARIPLAAAQDPVQRLRPALDGPAAQLLEQASWGRFAPVINDLIWRKLLGSLDTRPAPDEDALYKLDRAAARAFQIEISARGYFDGEASPHMRVLTALEAADPALARLYRSASSRQRLLMQAVRNLAGVRRYAARGEAGETVAYDPAFHTLVSDGEGKPLRVRLLDPPITREYEPGRHELLQQGECGPVEDPE